MKVVSVSDFAYELAVVFALFLFFFQAFLALSLRFVLALVDNLLDALVFLGGIFF